MHPNVCRTLIAICMAACVLPISAASVPDTLNIQGQLQNSAGTVLTGTHNFTFRLYDIFTGGSPLFEQNSTLTLTSQGIYTATLSDMNLSFSRDYFLSVEVNGDSEMSPRINLTSAAYSFRANVSDNLNRSADYVVNNLTANRYVRGIFDWVIRDDSIYWLYFNGTALGFNTSILEGNYYNKTTSDETFLMQTGGSIIGNVNITGDLNLTGNQDLAGNLTVSENVTASGFEGLYDWIIGAASLTWLSFNGSTLDFITTPLTSNYYTKSNCDSAFVNQTGGFINGDLNVTGFLNVTGNQTIWGNLTVTQNITARRVSGIFDWVVGPESSSWLYFNGTRLGYNTTTLSAGYYTKSAADGIYFNQTGGKITGGVNITSELNVTGETKLGSDLNLTGNNITDVDCVLFSNGFQMCAKT